MQKKHSPLSSAQGFSLVEILVALLILSVGILGMLALQAQSIKSNISSDQRTHALMILDSIEETILADRVNKGASICTANALTPFANNLSGIDSSAALTMTGAGAPCPTNTTSDGTNIYRFQVSWSELTSFTSSSRQGTENTVITREVRL